MVGVDSLDLSAHLFWPNLIRSRSMMGSTTLEDKYAGRLEMMVVGRSDGPLLEKAEKGRTRRFVLRSTTPSYTSPAEKWPTRLQRTWKRSALTEWINPLRPEQISIASTEDAKNEFKVCPTAVGYHPRFV